MSSTPSRRIISSDFPDIRRDIFVFPSCQSGQEDDEDDVAVDDGDFLNEDELAELQRDEENIKKEVKPCPPSVDDRLQFGGRLCTKDGNPIGRISY